MSIELCVLASGSGGNCTVVRTPRGVMLLDAGLGPRAMATRLAGTGVTVADVRAVCLTHLDRDHFNPNLVATLARQRVRVFCHASRVPDVRGLTPGADAFHALLVPFDGDEPFEPLPGLRASAFPCAHDADGSHAFVLDGHGGRAGYATDLGRVPPALLHHFCDLDLLAIESNYDPRMQRDSPRPEFLKHRITGGRGHLSNAQALAAVRELFDRCTRAGHPLPAHVVLLHRSRQCNCPQLLRDLFATDPRIAPRLTLTDQFDRTAWLRAARDPSESAPAIVGRQLSLTW